MGVGAAVGGAGVAVGCGAVVAVGAGAFVGVGCGAVVAVAGGAWVGAVVAVAACCASVARAGWVAAPVGLAAAPSRPRGASVGALSFAPLEQAGRTRARMRRPLRRGFMASERTAVPAAWVRRQPARWPAGRPERERGGDSSPSRGCPSAGGAVDCELFAIATHIGEFGQRGVGATRQNGDGFGHNGGRRGELLYVLVIELTEEEQGAGLRLVTTEGEVIMPLAGWPRRLPGANGVRAVEGLTLPVNASRTRRSP